MRGSVRVLTGHLAPMLPTVTLMTSRCRTAGPLIISFRLQSTTPIEQLVINGAAWESDNYYHRLGFQEVVRDSNRIKEHYHILAKHFHPDNPTAPPNATAAFQNIKEAYDHLTENAKDEMAGGASHNEYSYRFTDHERRQQQMRFLGEGVGLFMVMTIVFIFIVARHNNNRMNTRHLGHLAIIFLAIQVFPRLLAAAILYACHSNYLVSLAERTEQAAVGIIVERHEADLVVRVEGVDEAVRDRVVVQVTYPCDDELAKEAQDGRQSNSKVATQALTTLTFDSGVTRVTVPAATVERESAHYRVKVVDEARAFVVADRTFRL